MHPMAISQLRKTSLKQETSQTNVPVERKDTFVHVTGSSPLSNRGKTSSGKVNSLRIFFPPGIEYINVMPAAAMIHWI